MILENFKVWTSSFSFLERRFDSILACLVCRWWTNSKWPAWWPIWCPTSDWSRPLATSCSIITRTIRVLYIYWDWPTVVCICFLFYSSMGEFTLPKIKRKDPKKWYLFQSPHEQNCLWLVKKRKNFPNDLTKNSIVSLITECINIFLKTLH